MGVRGIAWIDGTNGRERPHKTFWAAESRKSGVAPAPARFGSSPPGAFRVVNLYPRAFQRDRSQEGEDFGEDEAEGRTSYILH